MKNLTGFRSNDPNQIQSKDFGLPPSIPPPSEAKFAAICTRIPNNALIAAECANLTGGVPDADGFAFCPRVEYIPRAAYVRLGLRILASGASLDDLVEAVVRANFSADEFRIEFCSLSPENRLPSQPAIFALANAIPFYPNLDHPKHRFLLVERDSGLWFGEIQSECQHTYQPHDAKPYRTSTSLSSRLSRALVNLVSPQARSLLDPCCGTGSILLEAQALGLQVYGADQNQMMVEMTQGNLAHFGYQAVVEYADIRSFRRTADVLVTDLPYGQLLSADEKVIRPILEHGRNLAPQAVYVSGYNITEWLAAAGYGDISVYPVIKRASFVRHVHVARRLD